MPSSSTELIDNLARTTSDIVSAKELQALIDSGRQLNIKYGVDCTAPFLHIGHAVNLWMMRQFQDAGHKVILLLGDITTTVGDPTGRSRTRPVIDEKEITRNANAFIEQASLVLKNKPEVFEVRRNSEWYEQMSIAQWLRLCSEITHAQLISRDMFQQRIAAGQDIAIHELCYPILQGYDSVALNADLTIVGTDQLFNEMIGRLLQKHRGQKPQVIITSKITPGIDGKAKQSKSLGNFIALTDTPRDKFGKIMSLPDHLVPEYMEVYTDLPGDSIHDAKSALDQGGIAIRNAKLTLAHALVRRYHGESSADHERDWFRTTFADRQTPNDVAEILVSGEPTVLELVQQTRVDLGNNEIRRLIEQRAIRLNDTVLDDPQARPAVTSGLVLKVGRRHWFRLVR